MDQESQDQGILEADEAEMINNIFELIKKTLNKIIVAIISFYL
mgnify:CR=1 FL=1